MNNIEKFNEYDKKGNIIRAGRIINLKEDNNMEKSLKRALESKSFAKEMIKVGTNNLERDLENGEEEMIRCLQAELWIRGDFKDEDDLKVQQIILVAE